MKKECIVYEAEIFIEKKYDRIISSEEQRFFITHCDKRLQATSTWTYSLLNLLTEFEAELDFLKETDML